MNLPVFRIPARPSFVVAVAACLMSAGVARARVFETYGQCLERYGKPVTTVKTDIGSNVAFLKNDVSVTVEFRKDTAVSVTYFKVPVKDREEADRRFSPEEIRRLLESNGGGRKWNPEQKDMNGRPYWKTGDNALTARVTDELRLRIEDNAEFLRKARDVPPVVKPAPRDLEGF